jgi:hypothetical protein
MDKIEDIEMIGPVMVEQSKPINKIGITALELRGCGVRSGTAAAIAAAGSETALASAHTALLTCWEPKRRANDDLVWSNLKTGNLIAAGAPSR